MSAPAQPVLVSALVSTYNAARYLPDCLRDLLAQTLGDRLEIIVIDSGSHENEREIVADFQTRHANLTYLRSEERETVYAAWNRGLAVARGRYVTNANTDDRHRRDALEVLARQLEANPQVALVYGDCLVTRNGAETFENARPYAVYNWLDFDRHQLLERGCFIGPQPMWRRSLHADHGGFDPAFVSAGDYEFCLRLALTEEFLHVPETLGLYLDSATSVEHANRARAEQEVALARARHARLRQLPATGPATRPGAAQAATGAVRTANALPPVTHVGSLDQAREELGRNDWAAAWRSVCRAIEVRPFHPEAFALLAAMARAAGVEAAARACAQQARALAPGWRAPKTAAKAPQRSQLPTDWLVLPKALTEAKTRSRPRLSVCLITRDEEAFLPRCLQSVQGVADQVIVVDTGSTDRTVELARAAGAEVHTCAWNDDFSAPRNVALEQATGDWVLILDADEELPAGSHNALRRELLETKVMGYRLPLVDVGREADGCAYVPRLFRNAPGICFVGRVHEHAFGQIESLRQKWGLENRLGSATIRHYGYTEEVTRSRAKIARNLKLIERALEETPGDPNLLMNHGLELVRSGDLAAGVAEYDKAWRIVAAQPADQVPPELRETLLTQLATHLMAQRAYAHITQLLTAPPAAHGGLTAPLHFALGLAQMQLGQLNDAVTELRQCLAKRHQPTLTPVNKDSLQGGPHHCLALCLSRTGDHADAESEFQLALKETPGACPVRLDYARFLHERGQAAEALQMFHQALSLDPTLLAAWEGGGRVALSRREFLEVAQDWTAEAHRHFAAEPAVIAQRAEVLLLSGKPEEALPLWRQIASNGSLATQAAVVVCETVTGENQYRPTGPATELTREFATWYRRLLEFGAEAVVRRLNERVDRLSTVLPAAARLLETALAEAAD